MSWLKIRENISNNSNFMGRSMKIVHLLYPVGD